MPTRVPAGRNRSSGRMAPQGPETGGERRPDGASSCVKLVETLTAEVKFLYEHSLQLKNALTKEEKF